MKLEQGKLFRNRTWHYLTPVIYGFGPEFILQFNGLAKYGVAIRDDDHKVEPEADYLYLMFDSLYRQDTYRGFVNWVRNQDYYITDYIGSEEISSRRRIVVVRVVDEFRPAYQKFIEGKYSEMYTPDQLDALFRNKKNEIYKVLRHDESMVDYLKKALDKRYLGSIKMSKKELQAREYDLPLLRVDEVFNAVTEGKPRYITNREHL